MVFLTSQEQKMLSGELGVAVQQSMEILVALGKIYGADKMIPVTSVQVAGVSYKTIGDAGLEYLNDLVANGAKVRVPTFLNPAGMDTAQWKELGVPEQFAKKQIQILGAYEKMGIRNTCTCTPYLIGIKPKFGEHIAWSESSAVAYSNSVLGARTNREGGPSALAAAICGVTPNYGFHLDKNRVSDFVVEVLCELKDESDFGAMGYYVGAIVKNRNPAFVGVPAARCDTDKLKALGAAMAASGSVGLFFVKEVTPEFHVRDGAEKISFTEKELRETKEKINSESEKENLRPQLISIGCPHASIDEIKRVAEIIKRKKITKLKCDLWICTARETKKKAEVLGLVREIESVGGKIVADTCMVVCPIEQMGFKVTACNSGKAAKYLPSLCKQKVVFGNLEELI
ncbi:MAG: aconitase X catalytic domain-containing protein [Candidatus Micrarchaeota archaeon]